MTTFVPKNWQDTPSTATPISADALEDMEERITDWVDEGTRTPQQTAEGEPLELWEIAPFTSDAAPFQVHLNSFANIGGGAGTRNRTMHFGFNASRHSNGSGTVEDKPAIYMGFEDNYYDNGGDETYGVEWYVGYVSPDGTSIGIADLRPFYARVESADNSADNATIYHEIGEDGNGQWLVRTRAPGDGGSNILRATEANVTSYKDFYVEQGKALFTDAVIGREGANDDLRFRCNAATGQIVFSNADASANNLTIDNSGNFSLRDGMTFNQFGSTGTKIGGGASQKFGFYGATPVARPTGVAVTAAGIHAALVTLGLIAA